VANEQVMLYDGQARRVSDKPGRDGNVLWDRLRE